MHSDPTNQGDPVQWQRVEKPDFGYAAHVPHDWEEYPADLKNSPFETARFAAPADRRHSVIVFRGMPRPGLSAAERAERAQASLEAAGFGDFEITEAEVAGQPGARLDCVKRDAGRTWAVREYFVGRDDTHFVLGCGSSVPDEDDALFTQIAERFEFLSGLGKPAASAAEDGRLPRHACPVTPVRAGRGSPRPSDSKAWAPRRQVASSNCLPTIIMLTGGPSARPARPAALRRPFVPQVPHRPQPPQPSGPLPGSGRRCRRNNRHDVILYR